MASATHNFARIPPRASALRKADIRNEIERFGAELTSWTKKNLQNGSEAPEYTSLQDLVYSFKTVALDAYKHQKHVDKQHSIVATASGGMDMVELWQQESKTWGLLHELIAHQSPFESTDGVSDAQNFFPDQDDSEESDLLREFCLHNPDARIMCTLLHWLESNADQQYNPSPDHMITTTHLNSTREKIKGYKRMRQETGPLNLDNDPSSQKSLGITWSLDPDGPSRQGASMVDSDLEEDHNVWKQLYLFLRCGKSVQDIYKFCELRGELWRFLSFGMGTENEGSRYRHLELPNAQARLSIWKKAGLDVNCDRYRAACYAILSGSSDMIHILESVSQSWEGVLYAHVNSWVVEQLTSFALNSPQKAPKASLKPWAQMLAYVLDREGAKSGIEFALPRIQISLINRSFISLARDFGSMLSSHWKEKNRNRLSPFIPCSTGPEALRRVSIPEDSDVIRVMANAVSVYVADHGHSKKISAEDPSLNVVIAYIDYLIQIGSYDTISAYLKILPSQLRLQVLGYVLTELSNEEDRKALLKMLRGDIAGEDLASHHYDHVLNQSGFRDALYYEQSPFALLEPTNDSFYPGFRIKPDIGNHPVSYWENQAINAAELIYLTREDWSTSFEVVTRILCDLLLLGKVPAARELTRRLSCVQISQVLSPNYFNESLDIMSKDPTQISNTLSHNDYDLESATVELREQALVLHEIQQLVKLIECTSEYDYKKIIDYRNRYSSKGKEESPIDKHLGPTQRSLKPFLDGALGVNAFVVTGKWFPELQHKLELVCETYLPQAITASLIVFHSAAQISDPDYISHFVLSAIQLATDRNLPLMAYFVRSQQLESFRKVLTKSSLTLLRLAELREQGVIKSSKEGNKEASSFDVFSLWSG